MKTFRSACAGLFFAVVPATAETIIQQKLPAVDADGANILSLTFAADGSRVVGNLSNGAIYAWPLSGDVPALIAQTEQAFAYCPAGERMVISAGKAAVLLSLRDGGYAALSEGLYDHADFSADCNAMILAEPAVETVEHWQISQTPDLRNAAILAPARNGVAISSDGRLFAAATAPLLEDAETDTAIETFALTETGLRRLGHLQLDDTIIGLGGIALTTDGVLVTSTRSAEGTSGVLAVNAATSETIWSWAGFPAEAVTSLTLSSDELTILTTDSSGRVVLWSVNNGRNLAQVSTGQPILASALSRDVSKAAVALQDGTILVLDIETLLSQN